MKAKHLLFRTGIALCTTLYFTSCREMEPEQAVINSVETGMNRSAAEVAYPGEDGVTKQGTLFGKQITFTEINGKAVFEGDIILTAEQLGQTSGARNEAFTQIHSLWPNNTVSYTIDASITDKAPILAAIADIEANTPLRFALRKPAIILPGQPTIQQSYVTFSRSRGYSSSIGRIGGEQFITVPAIATKGGVLHEIGHTVGLLHEHTRQDRDASVKVNLNNVADAAKPNFTILDNEGYDNVRYSQFDFGSIMMLDSWAYSKNGLPTMTKLNNTTFPVQREHLAATDINCITAMYSNVFAVTPNGIWAGDAASGKKAPWTTFWAGAGEIYALSNLVFLSKNTQISRLNAKTGKGYGITSGSSTVKAITYYKGNIYTLQDGAIWKIETANGTKQAFTGQYFGAATALAYSFGLPYLVNGDNLYIISYDGKTYSSMGTGYTGVTEMAGWKKGLYVLKPNGKLYKVDPTTGASIQFTAATFAANAQLTSTGTNLLVVSQGVLYSLDEAGNTKAISGGWVDVTDLTAFNSED